MDDNEKFGSIDPKRLSQIREEADITNIALEQIGEALKKVNKELSKESKESEFITKTAGIQKSIADDLSKVIVKQLKNKKELNKLEENSIKLQSAVASLQARINNLKVRSKGTTGQERNLLEDAVSVLVDQKENTEYLLKLNQELVKEGKKLGSQTKFFEILSHTVEEIPVLGKFLSKPFEKAAEAAKETAYEGKGIINTLSSGFKVLGKELLTFVSLGKLIEILFHIDKSSASIANSLNVSTKEARSIERHFINMSFASGQTYINSKDLVKANLELNQSLGTSAVYSNDLVKNYVTLTERLKLSNEEAIAFSKLSAINGKTSEKNTKIALGSVKVFNAINKLALDEKTILKDISNTNASIQLNYRGQTQELAKAVMTARQYGLNIEKVDSIANGLLDFESSITAELEARVLTGKNLNLEQARYYALTNDIEGLTKELAKNGLNSVEWGNLNKVQQESYAKALGMSRGEMSKMILDQKALAELQKKEGFASVKSLDLTRKQYDELVKRVGEEEALALIGNKELAVQQQNLSVQERLANSMEKLNDTLVKLAKPLTFLLDGLGKLVDFLSQSEAILNSISKILLVIVGLKLSKSLGVLSLLGNLKNLKNIPSNIGNTLKGLGGGGGEVVSGSLKGFKAVTETGKTLTGAAAKTAVEAGTAKVAEKGAANIAKGGLMSGMTKLFSNPMNIVKGIVSKTGGLGNLLKNAFKKLPGLNTLLSVVFGIQEISSLLSNPVDENGDKLSKKQLASKIGQASLGTLGGALGGALGTLLGPLGTLVGSFGGDWLMRKMGEWFPDFGESVGQTTYDIGKTTGLIGKESEGSKILEAEDFIIKTHPKDTIVAAGGTNLGRTDEIVSLLEKLIFITENRRGDVLLDSNKVGISLTTGTSTFAIQ